jgi:hypothetical protein
LLLGSESFFPVEDAYWKASMASDDAEAKIKKPTRSLRTKNCKWELVPSVAINPLGQ